MADLNEPGYIPDDSRSRRWIMTVNLEVLDDLALFVPEEEGQTIWDVNPTLERDPRVIDAL